MCSECLLSSTECKASQDVNKVRHLGLRLRAMADTKSRRKSARIECIRFLWSEQPACESDQSRAFSIRIKDA